MNTKTLLFCSFVMLLSMKWEFIVLNRILCLLFSTLRFHLKTKVLSSGHGTWFTKENNYACILKHLPKNLEADVALITHYWIKRKKVNKWDRYKCSFVLSISDSSREWEYGSLCWKCNLLTEWHTTAYGY